MEMTFTAAGGILANACYWKNGSLVKVDVDDTSANSRIFSISASGGVVFSCGGEDSLPVYWINKKKYVLPGGPGAGYSIAVDKETLDFYIAGTSDSQICYWVNGNKRVILYPTNSSPRSIAVSNGKIYIGGTYNSTITCYWINGKMIELPGGGFVNYGISIYNGSAYFGGRNSSNNAVIWKDNSLLWTEGSLTPSNIVGIAVYEDIIYAAGYYDTYPYFWKNNISKPLYTPNTGTANCISLKLKK